MDSFPKCQVCQQHFIVQGPAPYLLPCLHAVCETCVTSTAGGVMSCSTCHRDVSLTETHLQKDVVRQREIFNLTVQHRPSELLCTHEDDGNQAVCWCPECEELLCEYCQNLHDSFKAMRKHVVQDIRDLQPGSQDHREYCITHTEYPLDTWDRSCKVLICARCRLGDHSQHDLEEVSAAAAVARSGIEAQQKNVLQVMDKDNSLLETTREQIKRMTETSKTLRDNITHTFQSLRSVLDQREKELHIFLQQHRDQAISHLDARTKVTQSHHLRCQITSEYTHKALLYSTNCELLKVKGAIEEKTQTCLDSTIEQEDVPVPEFFTGDLDKLKTQLSSFGDIHTHKDTSSQGRDTKDKQRQQKLETHKPCDRSSSAPRRSPSDVRPAVSRTVPADEIQTQTAKLDRAVPADEIQTQTAKTARSLDEARPVSSDTIPDSERVTDSRGRSLEPGDAVGFKRDGGVRWGIYVGGREVVWSEETDGKRVHKEKLNLTGELRKATVSNERDVRLFPAMERVRRAESRVGSRFTEGDVGWDGLDFPHWIYSGLGGRQAFNRGFKLLY